MIGREEERQILKRALDSKEAELIAVYGRRRVGKTYLISRFFSDKGKYFELTGISGGSTKQQLRNFYTTFCEAFKAPEDKKRPNDWLDAFDMLRKAVELQPKSKNVILFFDEFPWLATKRSGPLLSAFEHLWNRYLSRMPNVKVIVCGSAASWMIKKIVHNTAGLYGRLTQKLHLLPLSLHETEKYLSVKGIHLDKKQIVEIYLAIGGIPKYLNHVERGLSSAQIIQSLCFSTHGFLKAEFLRLYQSLFSKYEKHVEIVRTLAKKHQGLTLNKISEITKLSSGGTLATIIEELEASGFIRFVPFYGKKKRDGHYRLIDEYSLFYLTWIEPVKSNRCHENYWLSMHKSAGFISWAGYAFENVCIKHIDCIIEGLKLSVVAKSFAYWAYRAKKDDDYPGAQIDLIIDRADRCMNLCEMKFCENEYIVTSDYARVLEQKRMVFREKSKTKKALFNTLITPFGAKKTKAYLSSVDSQLDCDALFLPR